MKPIVCWDFDETLGYFRPLEFAWIGQERPASLPPVRLKPGIGELLGALQDFTHVVTTAALRDYARSVLADQRLLVYFAGVFGREDGIWTGEAKDYAVVGRHFGIPDQTLRSRLVIIGNDAERDPDCHHRQVVMVHDRRMLDRPAAVLGVVLRSLAREGEGDIKRGFDAMNQRAGALPLALGDDVKVRLDYWGSYAAGRIHPIVSTSLPMC
jgi:hypothetical protein